MNSRRIFLGAFLVIISLFLVVPKPGMQMLNWGGEVLALILALLPVLLIVKGLLVLQRTMGQESHPHDSGDERTEAYDFETRTKFVSKGNWVSKGFDLWQATIEDDKLKPVKEKDICHYAKKFRSVAPKSVKIESNISEDMKSNISVVVGTGSTMKPVEIFDHDGCEDLEEFEISDSEVEIKPRLDFEKYSFVEIIINRRDKEDVILYNVTISSEKL